MSAVSNQVYKYCVSPPNETNAIPNDSTPTVALSATLRKYNIDHIETLSFIITQCNATQNRRIMLFPVGSGKMPTLQLQSREKPVIAAYSRC